MTSWFKKKRKKSRHGDLLIREVSSIPDDVVPLSTNIIAKGEKTGHNHELNGAYQIYETLDKQIYFEAKQDLEIKHPEHNTIQILKGKYVVVHEREHKPFDNIEEDKPVRPTWNTVYD